jgi:hypothetical protein
VESKPVLEASRWEYGKAVARKAAKDGRAFGLASTVVTLALPTAVGFATTSLSVVWQVFLIVVTGAVGYLLVPAAWAACGSLGATSAKLAEALRQLSAVERREDASPASPRIEFGVPLRASPRAFRYNSPQGAELNGEEFTPIVLPIHVRGGTVNNCRATVEFRGAEGFEQGMRGRWENHGEPKRIWGEDISYLDRIQLLKDEDEAIAIAVQHERDPHIYMLCNRSWVNVRHFNRPDLRLQELVLPHKGPIAVRVTVRGDEIEDSSCEFALVHGERGEQYRWKPIVEDDIGNPLPPFEAAGSGMPSSGDGVEDELQQIRLVQGELRVGRATVEAAIGISQVHRTVTDTHWKAQQGRLAAIPEAGDGYSLAVESWVGFEKYNEAVRKRTFISDDDLQTIAKTAQRAIDALDIAATDVRARQIF